MNICGICGSELNNITKTAYISYTGSIRSVTYPMYECAYGHLFVAGDIMEIVKDEVIFKKRRRK